MDLQFNIGDVVMSKAGRDKDRYFIVVNTEDIFCFVCDGDLRKIVKPKKKKMKHLINSGVNSSYITEKLKNEGKVTNTELRRAISEFLEEAKGCGAYKA